MKKKKDAEKPTHREVIELLIDDENIRDNLNVSEDYSEDSYGNSLITMGFRNDNDKKKPTFGVVAFTFNIEGRLIGLQIATKKKGEKKWHSATSEVFVDFESRLVGKKDN